MFLFKKKMINRLRPHCADEIQIPANRKDKICLLSLVVVKTYPLKTCFLFLFNRDALIVTTLDTFTSLLSGFTIFGILGNLAHNLGAKNIDDVVKSGTGLAFISYPDAISKFDVMPQVSDNEN